MKGALPTKNKGKFRVLVAPLDWGLGHATRCIPLIKQLKQAGADIWLAGSGAQEALLRSEFPDLPFLPLKGYGVSYSRNGRKMNWKILAQLPKISQAIKTENKWLAKMIAEYSFDAVISDNRYGLHHPDAQSIIITHQLRIKTGLGKWAEEILQKWNYKKLKHFDQCWVPDQEGNGGLAGELSHPEKLPAIPIRYTGILSRFEKLELPEKKNKLLIILSGPEPQRTILEEMIFRDISHYNGEAAIVRGLPASRTHVPSTGMISIYNHLETEMLNKEMSEAEFVIARSGYSTIMDAFHLNKKCIFIPTPGQTEQEYLALYLQDKRWAFSIGQDKFRLEDALKEARGFSYSNMPVATTVFDHVNELIEKP